MPLDQVSVFYVVAGSARTRFPVSATKQITPIDGAFQNPTNTNCRASPETQISKAATKTIYIEDNFWPKNPKSEATPLALYVTYCYT